MRKWEITDKKSEIRAQKPEVRGGINKEFEVRNDKKQRRK